MALVGSSLPWPKIVAAIPCYNEESFIGGVVLKAMKYVDQVVVIDDGSSDGTSQAARAAGASVIIHETNRGPGAATRSCFEASKTYGADILVTLDGDSQHNPEEIPLVIAPILNGEADLVIGSRFLRQGQRINVPKYRRFGIDVITWLFNVGSRTRIADAQSCFRAYSRRLLDTLSITENGFGFSVEVLVQARQMSFPIREVAISCVYHANGSTINPVYHGLGVALATVKLRFKTLW